MTPHNKLQQELDEKKIKIKKNEISKLKLVRLYKRGLHDNFKIIYPFSCGIQAVCFYIGS